MKAEEYDVIRGASVPRLGTEAYRLWEGRPEAVRSRQRYGGPVYGDLCRTAALLTQLEASSKEPRVSNPYLVGNDDAADLLARNLQPPPFLVDGVLASGQDGEGGTVAFLAGNPGVGKTYAALHLMHSVALGLPWFDIPTLPAPVGGIFLESPAWMLQERLKAISEGFLPKGCLFLRTAADLRADAIDVCDPRHRAWIIEWARRRGLGLIVIDPFAFLHRLDEAATADAVQIGESLKGIARETEAPVLVLDHFRKSTLGTGPEDVLQALRGAIAKSAFAGAVMGMDEYAGVIRLRFGKVAARALPEPIYLVRDPRTGALFVTQKPHTQTEAKVDRLAEAREILADGEEHTAKELAQALGIQPDTFRKRYVEQLGLVPCGPQNKRTYRLADTGSCPDPVRPEPQLGIDQ